MAPFERAGEGYAETVASWLENPHAAFKAFGPEARAFQNRHRSERLRTMTLVAPAEELVAKRPVYLSVDGADEKVTSWENVFAVAAAAGMFKSNGEARRMAAQGGLSLNVAKVDDKRVFAAEDFIEGKVAVLKQGKKNNFLLKALA